MRRAVRPPRDTHPAASQGTSGATREARSDTLSIRCVNTKIVADQPLFERRQFGAEIEHANLMVGQTMDHRGDQIIAVAAK